MQCGSRTGQWTKVEYEGGLNSITILNFRLVTVLKLCEKKIVIVNLVYQSIATGPQSPPPLPEAI